MKFSVFKEDKNIETKLLRDLGILVHSTEIISVDYEPKYYYAVGRLNNYCFAYDWIFYREYNSIIKMNIINQYLIQNNTIKTICGDYDIVSWHDNPVQSLRDAKRIEPAIYALQDESKLLHNFNVDRLEVGVIDNSKHKALIEGNIRTNASEISSKRINLLLELEIFGVPGDIRKKSISHQLLAEGFTLYKNGDYKLAYFILFTAMESFVNGTINGYSQIKKLADKLEEAFSSSYRCLTPPPGSVHFPCYHQIYETLMGGFNSFVAKRNAIGHGGKSVGNYGNDRVESKDCRDILIFASVMLSSFYTGICNYSDLKQYLKDE